MPVAPVSKVHAGCSRATFAGVICFSGEKRRPAASPSCDGQSLASAAASAAARPAHTATVRATLRMCIVLTWNAEAAESAEILFLDKDVLCDLRDLCVRSGQPCEFASGSMERRDRRARRGILYKSSLRSLRTLRSN